MNTDVKGLKWCDNCGTENCLVEKCNRRIVYGIKQNDCVISLKCNTCGAVKMIVFPNRLNCKKCPMYRLKQLNRIKK